MALSSVNSTNAKVQVQSEHLQKFWQGLQSAEDSFFGQSETIGEHLAALDDIVARLENPTRRAMDEVLEVTFEKGKHMADKLRHLSNTVDRPQLVAKLETKVDALLDRSAVDESSTMPLELRRLFGELKQLVGPSDQLALGHATNEPIQAVGEGDADPAPVAAPPTQSLPRGWRTAHDMDGRVYYYHKTTRKVQWHIPAIDEAQQHVEGPLELSRV